MSGSSSRSASRNGSRNGSRSGSLSRSNSTARTNRSRSGSRHRDIHEKLRDARHSKLRFASSKLDIIKNPLQENEEDSDEESLIKERSQSHSRHRSGSSEHGGRSDGSLHFSKRESASASELFYDLWFVANLNVFATVHPITEPATLVSFIGYFLLLWTTWLVTTLFDARFGQDGILERIARACHLAVMIGFAEAGASFDRDELVRPIFISMSLFLMFSRLVLAAQYGMVLFHAHKDRQSRNALIVAIALHLIPAIAYLVVALIPSGDPNRRLVLIWYIGGLGEMAALIMHATLSTTLSFEGTHFNERLNLLTLIILGEGVIILAKNITKVVEYTYIKDISNNWSPALIGIITCAAAIIYITFQLYFDWMHHHNHMGNATQAYWALIHLPFHIALVLLAEGGNQWVVWWRSLEAFHMAGDKLDSVAVDAINTGKTAQVVDALKEAAKKILKDYGASIEDEDGDTKYLNKALDTISKIPDQFWNQTNPPSSDPNYKSWVESYLTISSTVLNTVSDAFGISVEMDEKPNSGDENMGTMELEAVNMTITRLRLIFSYLFASAGVVLVLLMVLHLLSKRKGWTLFNIFRTVFVFCIGVGLGLIALIATNVNMTLNFLQTPWQLPIITISYMVVLILTHLPHPPRIFLKPSEIADLEDQKRASSFDETFDEQQGGDEKPKRPQRLTMINRATRRFHIEPGPVAPITQDFDSSNRDGMVSYANLARVR